MTIALVLILAGAICQVVGMYKGKGSLIVDGFILQSIPFWIAIPFLIER